MSATLGQFGRGANDTAASYGSIMHGRPDPVQLSLALANSRSLYPRLDSSAPTYQRAWKGLYVFTDTRIDNRTKGPGGPETDHVWYMQCLNGLYDSSDEPWKLVSRLNTVGLTEDDILAAEGPSQTNTILVTGKDTTPNTGPLPISGGQYYYLDFPSKNKDKMYTGGCSKMTGVPENFLCLWTMPYNPSLHRCIPIGLYHYYSDKTITENDTEFGQKMHAKSLLTAVLDSSLVVLGMLAQSGIIERGQLSAAIKKIDTKTANENFEQEFARRWLHPMSGVKGNLMASDNDVENMPQIRVQTTEDVFQGGSAFLPTSMQFGQRLQGSGKTYRGATDLAHTRKTEMLTDQRVVLAQITSAEDLCVAANAANTYFTSRIKGKAETSADPGLEMDVIQVGIRGFI